MLAFFLRCMWSQQLFSHQSSPVGCCPAQSQLSHYSSTAELLGPDQIVKMVLHSLEYHIPQLCNHTDDFFLGHSQISFVTSLDDGLQKLLICFRREHVFGFGDWRGGVAIKGSKCNWPIYLIFLYQELVVCLFTTIVG